MYKYLLRIVCVSLICCSSLTTACNGGGDPSNPTTQTSDSSSTQDLSTEDIVSNQPFEIKAFNRVRISSHSDQPNFQNALTDIDWGDGPFARVTLVVDLESSCFPFDQWTRPPEGHNWPADCDAFDRNFEFVLDPATSEGAPPGFELVRAITPFGGPLHLEVDVTDIANGLPGKHTLQTHITTWSDSNGQVSGADGGWWVSATLRVEPGVAPRSVLGVVSLLNTSIGSDASAGEVSFTAPSGTESVRFEYRATGHGGATDDQSGDCIGPAEEFCERRHVLSVDSRVFAEPTLWREDCDSLCTLADQPRGDGTSFSYCKENPCGAISSVRAPRANWCPGSVTEPLTIYLDGVQPGQLQRFGYEVKELFPGGSWRVSATLIFLGN